MKYQIKKRKLDKHQFKLYTNTTEFLTHAHDSLRDIDLRRFRGDDEVRELIQDARAAVDSALIAAQTRMYG